MNSPEKDPASREVVHTSHFLDAIAEILRALGENAFDTHAHKAEALRAKAEQWARHLLVGAEHPERPGRPSTERDHLGVRRFVRETRVAELQYVRSALHEFRKVVWSVFSNLQQALTADGEADGQVMECIARLERVVGGSSLEELRREVETTTRKLASLLEQRERRRKDQLDALGGELRQLHTRLEETRRTAETCPLTKLYNRRALDAYIERVVEFDGLTGTPVSLMMMDVDNFKRINDEYGHPTGDAVLRALGDLLAKTFMRKCDFVARYGGEEFVVILRDALLADAQRLGDRVRLSVVRLSIEGQPEIELSISVGVAQLVEGEAPTAWLARADTALLSAKRAGKNRVVLARP